MRTLANILSPTRAVGNGPTPYNLANPRFGSSQTSRNCFGPSRTALYLSTFDSMVWFLATFLWFSSQRLVFRGRLTRFGEFPASRILSSREQMCSHLPLRGKHCAHVYVLPIGMGNGPRMHLHMLHTKIDMGCHMVRQSLQKFSLAMSRLNPNLL